MCVAGSPASSPMVGGIEARIHKLPSSSAGKNSLPSHSVSNPVIATNATAQNYDRAPMRERPSQGRRVDPAQHPHDDCLSLLDALGKEERRQHRRDCEGRDQRADQRKRIGARHRAENLAFDALHREQRHEGRDRNQTREEDGFVDLQGARENNSQSISPGAGNRGICGPASDRGQNVRRPAAPINSHARWRWPENSGTRFRPGSPRSRR